MRGRACVLKELKLDNRLSKIYDLVRTGVRVADVGTDHGYLIVELVLNGKCTGGLACDLNMLPLQKAQTLIAKYALEDKIQTRLSNGLQAVEPDEIQDIVIAGMGGDLISKIIANSIFIQDEKYHLILQPMTKVPLLRKNLYAQGFEIKQEVPVIDGKFSYTILSVGYTGCVRIIDEVFALVGKIPDSTSPFKEEYLSKIATGLFAKAEGIRQAKNSEGYEQAYAIAQKVQAYLSN